jgi:hypothetical protein
LFRIKYKLFAIHENVDLFQSNTSLNLATRGTNSYYFFLLWRCKVLFYSGVAKFCSIRAVQGFVLFGRCKVLFYSGGARFCSIQAVQGFVLFRRCKVLFYLGGARFCSFQAVQGFVLFGRCKVLFYSGGATVTGLGMCKSVSIKNVVQKKAVGGAKNGGRGLEKTLTRPLT